MTEETETMNMKEKERNEWGGRCVGERKRSGESGVKDKERKLGEREEGRVE